MFVYLRLNMFSPKEEEFLNVSAKKCSEIDNFLDSPHVTTYLKTNWFTYAELWVNFGRTFYHCSSETNNKAERYFTYICQ